MPKTKSAHTPPIVRHGERGNVFLLILLGIALFAAISFTMSRGMRTEGVDRLDDRKAELLIAEISSDSQKFQRAVDLLRRKGCSENQLSFWGDSNGDGADTNADDYHNPNAPTDRSCHIFDSNGAHLRKPENWNFLNVMVFGITDDPAGGGPFSGGADLLAVREVDIATCQKINTKFTDYTGSGFATENSLNTVPSAGNIFIGTYNDAGGAMPDDGETEAGAETFFRQGHSQACIARGGASRFYYYKVLLER